MIVCYIVCYVVYTEWPKKKEGSRVKRVGIGENQLNIGYLGGWVGKKTDKRAVVTDKIMWYILFAWCVEWTGLI